MKSSVTTFPFWWRRVQYWCAAGENSGMPTPVWIFSTEEAAGRFHRHLVDRYCYWHNCQNFIGEITPLDEIEFMDDECDWEYENE